MTPNTHGERWARLAKALVMLTILGVVAAMVGPNLYASIQRKRQQRTMSDMRSLATALGSFAQDNDGYPADDEGVARAWSRLTPRYITDPPTKDRWGHDFLYQAPADMGSGLASGYTLISFGSDGKYQGRQNDLTKYFDCDLILSTN